MDNDSTTLISLIACVAFAFGGFAFHHAFFLGLPMVYALYVFGSVFEIRSREGVLHFRRWRFADCDLFGIYLHCIYRSDADDHKHNHPWSFVSIIIKGGYREYGGGIPQYFKAPAINVKAAKEYHQLTLRKPVWTLVFRGPKRWADKRRGISDWGYKVDGAHVRHDHYRARKERQR